MERILATLVVGAIDPLLAGEPSPQLIVIDSVLALPANPARNWAEVAARAGGIEAWSSPSVVAARIDSSFLEWPLVLLNCLRPLRLVRLPLY